MTADGRLGGPMIFTPEYYQRMRELESSGWWNAGMRDAGARLLALAELPERGRLLDLGCGSGQTMAWFREAHPDWTTVGLDVALEGLRAGRALGESGILAASALQIPLDDASVDLVITLDVLQHLPLNRGDETALAELHRVLRPGGYLLARTNAQAFPRTPDDPEHDFHKYRPAELARKMTAAGFTVIRLSRLNALLGLAEIPRELRANHEAGRGYHGILSDPGTAEGLAGRLKRRWLSVEARAVARGWKLPAGRTLLALCRR